MSWLKPGGFLLMTRDTIDVSPNQKENLKEMRLHNVLLSMLGTSEYNIHKNFILQSNDKDLKRVLQEVEYGPHSPKTREDVREQVDAMVLKEATRGALTVKQRREGGIAFIKTK
jgi:hypothetical protein